MILANNWLPLCSCINKSINMETTNRIEDGERHSHTCLSCGMEYEGNYCPNCGQSKRVGRLSLKRLLTESLPDIYNLDNRFMRTCVDLFRRPGKMIMEYIKGNRVIYYKPVSLLFVLASILIIVKHLCNIETTHEFDPNIYKLGDSAKWCEEGTMLDQIVRTIYYLYWNDAWSTIVSITLLIWPLKVAFRKTEVARSLNLAEFFFIMLFLNCQSFIIKIFQIPLNFICSHWSVTSGLFDDGNVDLVCMILWIWAFMQIFGTGKRRTVWNYFKAHVLMYTLIILVSVILSLLVSVVWVWVDKESNPFTKIKAEIENSGIHQQIDSIKAGNDSILLELGNMKIDLSDDDVDVVESE